MIMNSCRSNHSRPRILFNSNDFLEATDANYMVSGRNLGKDSAENSMNLQSNSCNDIAISPYAVEKAKAACLVKKNS